MDLPPLVDSIQSRAKAHSLEPSPNSPNKLYSSTKSFLPPSPWDILWRCVVCISPVAISNKPNLFHLGTFWPVGIDTTDVPFLGQDPIEDPTLHVILTLPVCDNSVVLPYLSWPTVGCPSICWVLSHDLIDVLHFGQENYRSDAAPFSGHHLGGHTMFLSLITAKVDPDRLAKVVSARFPHHQVTIFPFVLTE